MYKIFSLWEWPREYTTAIVIPIFKKINAVEYVLQFKIILWSSLFTVHFEKMKDEAIEDHRNGMSIGRSKIRIIKFAGDQVIVSGSVLKILWSNIFFEI